MTAYSARPTSTNELTQLVNQAHTFTVGQCVIYSGGAYIYAKANTLAHCAGTMIVSIVISPTSFYVTQTGYILNTGGAYSTGVQYYLDPTSSTGGLTTTKPTTVGQVVLPCFVADSATTGYFYGGSGELIESGSLFAWNPTAGSITMVVNNGYFMTAAGTMTLPTTYNQSDVIRICSHVGNGFTILQTQSYHQVFDLGLSSTSGATGTVVTVQNGASIELIAESSNGPWRVVSNKSNFTYA